MYTRVADTSYDPNLFGTRFTSFNNGKLLMSVTQTFNEERYRKYYFSNCRRRGRSF